MNPAALIDVHTHFFPGQLLEALEGRSEPPYLYREDGRTFVRFGPGRQYPLTEAMGSVDAKLAEMDRAGIHGSVLSVNMPGVDGLGDMAVSTASVVNDGLRAAASRDPARLAWMAVAPMERPEAVAEELHRCASLGASGVMIGSNVVGRPLDLDTDAGLFEAAHDLGLAIMVHPAFPLAGEAVAEYQLTSILGFLFDTTTATLRLVLAGMFDRYPDLKFVVSHVGGLLPFIVGRIDYLSTQRPGGTGRLSVPPSEHLRKLYVDAVCLWPPALRLGVEFFGADHVMFGSDHPYWPMADGVATLAEAALPPADQELVAHGTASALMNLGEPPLRTEDGLMQRAIGQALGSSSSERGSGSG
jgi:predicted TIM-barrel fold metal-dependent hydrolase